MQLKFARYKCSFNDNYLLQNGNAVIFDNEDENQRMYLRDMTSVVLEFNYH
jgi:hypothetical protein